jgi:ParB/RepB/Spo0J family partition protein
MEFKPRFDAIDISDIDLADQRFRISTDDPSETMMISIKLVGVISPPVVLPNNRAASAYTIVCGFKRLKACKHIGLKECAVKILPPDISLEHLIRIAIIDNTVQRELNFVEQARVIGLLSQLHSETAALCKEANRLGMPVNAKLVQKLYAVADMTSVLQNALNRGDVALPVALELNGMADRATADRITALFCRLGLGLNRQRETLDWLKAISRRDAIPVHTLLAADDIRRVMDDTDMDRAERGRRLRKYLKRLRYPELFEAEKHFDESLRALKLKQGIQLLAPPHFEGQTFSLKIDFKHQQDLISKYQYLKTIVSSSALSSLLGPSTPDEAYPSKKRD